MRAALHAEWTKMRTVPGPLWLLLGAMVATIALGAGATAVICTSAGCGGDPIRLSLLGVYLGQALIAIAAVLVISSEYGTGMIRTSLTALPRRETVLAAKAVVVAGTVAAAGTVAVFGSLLAGHAVRAVPLTGGPTLRATVGSILYLVVIGLLSLGVAAIARDSAASIGVVLGLLYLFPVLAQTIGNPHWQRVLEKIGPMSAGLAVQTADIRGQPIGPWTGLGVTAGWAAAALLTGGVLLRLRDP
jgi:ABC-2 type transport system permease protein